MDPLDEDWACELVGFLPQTTNLICRGFVWENNAMRAPPTLGGHHSFGTGVNNHGLVVGWAGSDVATAHRGLLEIPGVGELLATTIVMHALHWPDAFPALDGLLLRATGVSSPSELRARAEKWRPWRAYAALHLWLGGEDGKDA